MTCSTSLASAGLTFLNKRQPADDVLVQDTDAPVGFIEASIGLLVQGTDALIGFLVARTGGRKFSAHLIAELRNLQPEGIDSSR
ncbi:MAG: hypothetical protein AUH43_22010 [Acidobacteria bacterium 13_1_40CM_65_14]|nr:MAG: hypothetical protein AUH43_22010 [Acidobacteria bacterium 13_1_40CM_65_14]OLE79932.1 MAG: hypothetical protein AUF76_15515 [Acidobacteria bacterium 13_1_20CM_2_65_9]